ARIAAVLKKVRRGVHHRRRQRGVGIQILASRRAGTNRSSGKQRRRAQPSWRVSLGARSDTTGSKKENRNENSTGSTMTLTGRVCSSQAQSRQRCAIGRTTAFARGSTTCWCPSCTCESHWNTHPSSGRSLLL